MKMGVFTMKMGFFTIKITKNSQKITKNHEKNHKKSQKRPFLLLTPPVFFQKISANPRSPLASTSLATRF
jgi:hypothetical protein